MASSGSTDRIAAINECCGSNCSSGAKRAAFSARTDDDTGAAPCAPGAATTKRYSASKGAPRVSHDAERVVALSLDLRWVNVNADDLLRIETVRKTGSRPDGENHVAAGEPLPQRLVAQLGQSQRKRMPVRDRPLAVR